MPFPQGARVVFAGDSITCSHDHVARIAAHYRLREAGRNVRFWNAGISGASVAWTLRYFDIDISRVNPTHVPIMLGVNDSDRDALRLDPSSTERAWRLETAFARFRNDMGVLLDRIESIGAQAILCTPTPYAEFSPFTGWGTLKGGHALILRYADEVRRIASARNLPLVDFHAALCERYPAEKLYGDDRVHPMPLGHKLMAETFLAAQGLDFDDFATAEDAADAAGLRDWLVAWRHYRLLVSAEPLSFSADELALPVEERVRALTSRLAEKTASGEWPQGNFFRLVAEIYIADALRREELATRLDEMA